MQFSATLAFIGQQADKKAVNLHENAVNYL